MKIVIGKRYRVSDCSGLDSGRIGIAIPYSPSLWWSIPGTYLEYDKRWQILCDDKGNTFAMLKTRLTPVK